MSPEQAIGDPATDHRADIYAFGCLAYELFAGAPPFTGATNAPDHLGTRFTSGRNRSPNIGLIFRRQWRG